MRRRLIGRLYGLAYPLARLWWRIRSPVQIGVRAMVLRPDGHVLLVRHSYGSEGWGFPGGGPRRHEMLAATAVREVREETGIVCRVERVLGVYDSFIEGKSDHVAFFVCQAPMGTRPAASSPEILEARFFALDALPPGASGGTRRRLAELEAGGQSHWGMW